MASTLNPPTRLAGYVADDYLYYGVLGDVLERVPDLTWPLSVSQYSEMRRDMQLAAVLKAYTLPIRRATWTLDPAGCRPEVVQLVADDLGLPVVGQDSPGAARVRGVAWREHLRSALMCLVYGHAGFEMLADTSSGQARLVKVSERLQHTISRIFTDRDGEFLGITQDLTQASASDVPAIGADRMVWYAHEREGAAWQGTSLLRPAYAPWLLKREMMRVHATSNRRFGMGVPVARALPGATPTPQQHAAAAELAQQARVGDSGGGAMPPGYVLELIGLTGSVPDTLGFMRWLDQQMSRMALTGFLDLGETPNGSRALGDSFVDLFLLALQTVADDIADTATRQIAARLVEWNWGPGEPVPQITVADVGSTREITAESLQLLLASGALTADPDLEAYVRREWKLPVRAQSDAPAGKSYGYDLDYGVMLIDERRAQIGLPPLPDGAGQKLPEPASQRTEDTAHAGPDTDPGATTASASASRRGRSRTTAHADQLALPVEGGW